MKHNTVTTSAGITIGRSYIMPAPRELGSEAEAIQTALLKSRHAVKFHGAMKPPRKLPSRVSPLREFISVWWAYRKHHSWAYAARIAYGIAYKELPF